VAKGIGCASCHGRVDQMPLMYQAESLQMEWCLECHRTPEKFIRPRAEIYNMEWVTADQETAGARLIAEYNVQSKLSCSVCHR
jgi:NAD-dependent SIR2 family protein deacetylase